MRRFLKWLMYSRAVQTDRLFQVWCPLFHLSFYDCAPEFETRSVARGWVIYLIPRRWDFWNTKECSPFYRYHFQFMRRVSREFVMDTGIRPQEVI